MMFRFVFLRIQAVRTCEIYLVAAPYKHTEYPILGTPTPSSCKDAVTGSSVALDVALFDSFLAPLVAALCYQFEELSQTRSNQIRRRMAYF
jgi:hypothetical protein